MTTPQDVFIAIDHIVLDGPALGSAQQRVFGAALEAALTRLIGAHPGAWSGGQMATVQAEALAWPADPAQAGERVADAIYQAVTQR